MLFTNFLYDPFMATHPLTRYPEGSIRELWSISLPLMISALASLCMIFTDRLFLARYSLDALNAVVNAGTLAWAPLAGVGMMTAMSEVFVAQFNGAKIYDRIGVPVWQMIWLSLMSYVIFAPLGFLAGRIFSFNPNGAMEAGFFGWMMFFGPFYALMTAFAGFFIGRGKPGILIWIAVIANALNVFLDWILIFGCDPFIPEMGVKGAAIATSSGYVFQTVFLAVLFFRKKYRAKYGTAEWRLDFGQFIQCFKTGLPQGVFIALEVFGWAVFYWMMTFMSKTHITISGICQSLLILFSFFGDGVCRGIVAAAGNLIGSKKHDLLYRTMRSGLVLQFIFSLCAACLLLIDSRDLVRFLFLEHIESFSSPADVAAANQLTDRLRICLIFSFLYLFFENVRWVFSGLLMAAGDTLFLLIAGSLSVWVGLLIPVYVLVIRQNASVEYAWMIACIYSLALSGVYALRFKKGEWKKIDLIPDRQSVKGTESVSPESP